MSKTPEQMAEEYAAKETNNLFYREPLSSAFLAGYKAAQVELLQTISELEARIDNLERVHGDRRE